MKVSDIKDDAKEILGMCGDSILYGRLTHAIETLANKSQWQALMGYLDITVSHGDIVTLPRSVETPIKITINGHPTFSRTQLYEFTMNGPGTDDQLTGYSWLDRGTTPVMVPLPSPSGLKVVSTAPDNGKHIQIFGRNTEGIEGNYTFTLNSTTPPTSPEFAYIDRVIKDVTVGNVSVYTSPSNVLLSTYWNYETQPEYRQIKLSKAAASVRILFRKSTYKIESDEDFIPLHSPMAVLLMLKALEKYRRGETNEDFVTAKAYEDQAVKLCQEEQASRTGFDLSATTETQTPMDLNYNNSDSIIVADIYDEIASLLGPVGREKIYDFITEAREVLANKAQWDGVSDGYVDIVTENERIVTLPRYVEVPVAINLGGRPTEMKNKWFEFHLNGPGSNCAGSCNSWTDAGDTVTLKDVNYSQQLVAIADQPADNNLSLRVYGYFEEKWIQTLENGVMVDGFPVPCSTIDEPDVNSQFVDIITRITKPESMGFITLRGWDAARNVSETLGYYYPDETEPNYRRIKLPTRCSWIRMRYRRRSMKVRSLTDPLHLKSKMALMCMARAIHSLKSGDVAKASEMEQKAVQLLAEEQSSRNPAETFSLSFDTDSYGGSPEYGQY